MKKFEGAFTALVTPFMKGQLDEEGLAKNIRFQIEQGIDGIVPLGTTGESATLTQEEQIRVISIAVKEAKDKIPVMVGTGANCTRTTIEKTKRAHDLGADAALIVTPYYNKPTQEGIFRHFEAIATNVQIPIMVYNNPGRAVINIETSTLCRIAALPNIVGVKEASGNINQMGDVIHETTALPHFTILSGDDALTYPLMAMGGSGVISVLSNLVPGLVSQMVRALKDGNFETARTIHFQLLPLCKAAFAETTPVPIKTAMHLCGMAAGGCRLPLYEMGQSNVENLRNVLVNMKLV